MWLHLEFVICRQQWTEMLSLLSFPVPVTIRDQFCLSTNASVSDWHPWVTCSGAAIDFPEDLQMKKQLGDTPRNPNGRKRWLPSFGSWWGRIILFPGPQGDTGFGRTQDPTLYGGRWIQKDDVRKSASMSKIAFPSGWPHSCGTYGCKTHLGWAVLRELQWEEVKQGGRESWPLDCIGDHLVFIGFPSRCCVSRHLPPGPSVGGKQTWPRAPPSQPPGHRRALALTSACSSPWGSRGSPLGLLPGPWVSCPHT